MALSAPVEKLVTRKLRHSINGDPRKLRSLIESTRQMDLDIDVQSFVDTLEYSLDNDTPFSRIFLRVGKEMSKRYKQALATNLIYNSFIKGRQRRDELSTDGNIVPNLLVISPTMRCNLRCTGCYSGLYEKGGELSKEEIENVIDQARDLGIYFIVISGGEPYIFGDSLIEIFEKYNDMFFLTYTNGTYFDQKLAKKLKKLGNVTPAISVEGWQKETDERRGPGMWNRIHTAMDNLRRHGVMFGISITQTKYNLDTILDESFIEHFINQGAIYGWYFMFMPVGKDPMLDLVPTPEQRVHCANRVRDLRTKYPMFLADFWNDGDAVNGCMAGAKGYAHVINNGNVDVLREAVNEHLVPHGHQHSEDLIHDPEIVKWIDRYAEEFKSLVDPIWERAINNPNGRWYRYGERYRGLWRFHQNQEQESETREQGAQQRENKESIATPAG